MKFCQLDHTQDSPAFDRCPKNKVWPLRFFCWEMTGEESFFGPGWKDRERGPKSTQQEQFGQVIAAKYQVPVIPTFGNQTGNQQLFGPKLLVL